MIVFMFQRGQGLTIIIKRIQVELKNHSFSCWIDCCPWFIIMVSPKLAAAVKKREELRTRKRRWGAREGREGGIFIIFTHLLFLSSPNPLCTFQRRHPTFCAFQRLATDKRQPSWKRRRRGKERDRERERKKEKRRRNIPPPTSPSLPKRCRATVPARFYDRNHFPNLVHIKKLGLMKINYENCTNFS